MKDKLLVLIILLIIIFPACSNKKVMDNFPGLYDYWKNSGFNIRNDDVIEVHGKVKNLEHFEKFINSSEKSIRIVRTTIEADPVIYRIYKIKDGYRLIIDNSYDKYSNHKINEIHGKKIYKESNEKETIYYLLDFDNQKWSILEIVKKMS